MRRCFLPIILLGLAPAALLGQFETMPAFRVTGDKLATRTEDQAGFNSVIGPDRLAALPPASGTFQDLFALTAGASAGNPSAGIFSLRGLNQDNLFGPVGTGSNALIAVLEDGAPLSSATLRYLPPVRWDLAAAEVLRGPQSTSHGPNSLGGAVIFHRREPGFAANGQLAAEVSSFGGFQGGLAQDITLQPGEWALRLSYLHQQTDGEETNRFLQDRRLGATSRQDWRATLAWHPGKTTEPSVQLALIQARGRGNPMAHVDEPKRGDLFKREASLNTVAAYPADRLAANLRLALPLGPDLQLESTGSAQRLEVDALSDLDASSRLTWFARNNKDELRFTEDLILARRTGPVQWLAGGYVERSTYTAGYRGVGLAPFPAGSAFANSATETVDIGALYGRADWEFIPHLHLAGGVRLNHEARQLDFTSAFGPRPPQSTAARSTGSDWLPQIGLSWQPAPGRTLGVQVHRGYRGGGTSYAQTVGLLREFRAEHAWETEAFARIALASSLRWSGALFESRFTDQQVPVPVPSGFPGIDALIENAAASRRRGAELELEWQARPALAVQGSVAWLDTAFRRLTLGGRDLSGQGFPNAPAWTAALGLDYRPATGWFGSTLFSYSGSTYSQINSPRLTALEPRRLLSARFGYIWKKIRLYAFGTNLLNQDYALFRSDNTGLGLPVTGRAAASRRLGAGAEVRW